MLEKNPNLQNLLPQLDLNESHPLRFSPVPVEATNSAFESDDDWELTENPDGDKLIKFWDEVENDLVTRDTIDFEN